jgi:hypothetical protein
LRATSSLCLARDDHLGGPLCDGDRRGISLVGFFNVREFLSANSRVTCLGKILRLDDHG